MIPSCKLCGSQMLVKRGRRDGVQTYECANCGNRTDERAMDNPFHKKVGSEIIEQADLLLLSGLTVRAVRLLLFAEYGVWHSVSSIWEWTR